LRRLAHRVLARSLAQAGACLHAGLPDSEIIFRGIPDKFEETIIFGFIVNDDGSFVDLAADTDDIAADNGRRIAKRYLLRIRT